MQFVNVVGYLICGVSPAIWCTLNRRLTMGDTSTQNYGYKNEKSFHIQMYSIAFWKQKTVAKKIHKYDERKDLKH